MVKPRIIPTLLWKDGSLVKGTCFNNDRIVGSLVPSVRVYQMRDVDELLLIDITTKNSGADIDFSLLRLAANNSFVPLTFGGGVANCDQISSILANGGDKVLINTAAFHNRDFVLEAVDKFGSQCIVAGIDYKSTPDREICVFEKGEQISDLDPVEYAKTLVSYGVGEIVITNIDRDGLRCGLDTEYLGKFIDSVDVPVVVSGGVRDATDYINAFRDLKASAVAAASIFHFTEQTPLAIKKQLQKNEIQVRI